jgi:hypothetical protein
LGEIEINEYENYKSSIGLNLFVGFDVPISNRLIFEMKGGVFGFNQCLQAGLVINPF